ncbi:dihydrofolate reductase [Haloarcula salina]|uniref:dihydrofolate reductase n=1 Tax=Haloarcula salina TaxID=1429914 RepID=A0AA41G2S9_9EURY|nr:dihydrofolate reductase [Haloarcula salina]MBV0903120.1 dihydrofolate reductase [Haloarcula salina]
MTEADLDIVLHLVVAADENNVIGLDGGVPWHYPEDVRQYKDRIAGHPIILGRRTFDSMKSLEDSYTVVLTSDESLAADAETVEYVTTPRAAVEAASRATASGRRGSDEDAPAERGGDGTPVAYVIGGEAVYDLFLPFAERVFLSRIHERNEGDRYFPDLGDDWTEVDREPYDGFDVIEYVQESPRSFDAL